VLKIPYLFFVTLSSLFAAITPWPQFEVGQRVEIDGVCSGNWQRATILTAGQDPYSRAAKRYSAKFDDGHEWSFSGPGIVAPCIRAMSAAATAPVKPLAGFSGPRLQGLYMQLQSVGTAYTYFHYYFWPDGRYCEGLPSGGIGSEPMDFDSVQKQKKCGQYRITGSHMSLRSQGDPAPHDVSLANVHGDSFEMNGYATAKMASFGAGQRLNAAYSGTLLGKQTRKQTYTFRNDGTFQLNDQPVTSLDGAPKSDRGTYRLSNNTLELTGTSGTLRLTVYPFQPGGIFVESTLFVKE
jgi:hypothetical protein